METFRRHYIFCKELALVLYLLRESLLDLGIFYERLNREVMLVGDVLDEAPRLVDEKILGLFVTARRGDLLQLLEYFQQPSGNGICGLATSRTMVAVSRRRTGLSSRRLSWKRSARNRRPQCGCWS